MFADALHAKHDDDTSHSGGIVRISNVSVYASSTEQKVISRTSFEAVRMWLVIMPTIAFMKKRKSIWHKTRHITVRYFFIKEDINDEEV